MQNILITGSNRGIGLALTKLYRQKGCRVYAVCRTASPELKETDAVIIDGVDVSDENASSKIIDKIEGNLDLIINNAGIWRDESIEDFETKTIHEQFAVNSVAPLEISIKLLPKLAAGSKVAFITSRMGSIADNNSGGRFGYRMSKAALNAGAYSLAQDLKSKEIPVCILHPGYVRTDMTNSTGYVDPEESAQMLIDRIEETTMETTGKFLHAEGQELPW